MKIPRVDASQKGKKNITQSLSWKKKRATQTTDLYYKLWDNRKSNKTLLIKHRSELKER
jgi:hypothetical protein